MWVGTVILKGVSRGCSVAMPILDTALYSIPTYIA